MAIVRVQATSFSDGNSVTTYNAGSNFTAGNTVFLVCSAWQNVFTSVTIGGVVATKDLSAAAPSGGDIAQIWRADNVNGGRKDVVVNATKYITGAIIEVSGLASGGPDKTATATGTSTTPAATTAATTSANELVLACWSDGSANSDGCNAPATGFTLEYQGTGGGTNHGTFGGIEGGGGASKIVSATGTQSVTFTCGTGLPQTDNWACIIATYAQGSAAPTTSDLGVPPQYPAGIARSTGPMVLRNGRRAFVPQPDFALPATSTEFVYPRYQGRRHAAYPMPQPAASPPAENLFFGSGTVQ